MFTISMGYAATAAKTNLRFLSASISYFSPLINLDSTFVLPIVVLVIELESSFIAHQYPLTAINSILCKNSGCNKWATSTAMLLPSLKIFKWCLEFWSQTAYFHVYGA